MGSKVDLRAPTEPDKEIATRAHSLAREATTENTRIDPSPWAKVQLHTSVLRWARIDTVEQWKNGFQRILIGEGMID